MKRNILFLILILFYSFSYSQTNENINIPQVDKSALNFIVANDLGRNGYYQQKPIAKIMGQLAEDMSIQFIAAAGDIHHFEGVASVNDPLWMTNYELIYDHPELMIDWYAIAGNHEYRGNTQAVLDYGKVSRRWNAPSKYYTKVFQVDDQTACRLIFIDTTPLIDKYRNDPEQYLDAYKQDMKKQLQWIDSLLTTSTEKWKIVIGHHPVYADTKKSDTERLDMQKRIAPLLEKRADAYFCGHIHNFQHIKPDSSSVNYIVNSAGSLSRPVKETEGTLFCSSDPGFTVCSVTKEYFEFFFLNHKGQIIYSYKINK